jgi:hypothetical protein
MRCEVRSSHSLRIRSGERAVFVRPCIAIDFNRFAKMVGFETKTATSKFIKLLESIVA